MADGTSAIGARRRSRGIGRPSVRTLLLIAGPLALIAVAAWFFMTGGRYVGTDNAYVEADLLQLSTDVSGIVKEIDVTDNQSVQPGQVLFRLGDAPYRFAVANAEAQLAQARNDVEVMKANWHEKQQEIKLSEVDVAFARRDWARKHDLFDQHVVPQSAMDQSQQMLDGAEQKLVTVRQQLASLAAGLGGDPDRATDEQPKVKAAEAELDEAQHNLNDTIVKAPVAGVVTNVPSLQVGHFLQASTAAFGLVASKTVWIEADPKETQLTWVNPGQKATIRVDTYPGVEWQGTVASLSPASGSQFSLLPAQNTTGNWVKVVQRIPIRVTVEPAPDKPLLRAGMSAEIEIDTGHKRTWHDIFDSLGF